MNLCRKSTVYQLDALHVRILDWRNEMSYKFKLALYPKTIRGMLADEQKEMFKSIEILGANVSANGAIYIECLASEDEIVDTERAYVLPTNKNDRITIAED